jgi:hypothetical protein
MPADTKTSSDVEIEVKSDSAALAIPEHVERYRARGNVNDAERLFAHYPDEIRADGIWLWFFLQTRCGGEHAVLTRIAKGLGIKDGAGKDPSDNYWYQVATGRYFRSGGDTKAFRSYVQVLRAYERSTQESGAIPFQETRYWRTFRDYVDLRRRANATCKFGGIEGTTGSQKTWCGKHYAILNNHRETVHLEAPARATRARFIAKLAKCYLVPDSNTIAEKELAIERFLAGTSTDPVTGEIRSRTIIIDNVQRLFKPHVPADQQDIFNYLHELQDDTGCCIIMIWVPTFRATIESPAPFWQQFLGRIGGPDEILRAEQKLPKADLLKFARAFRVADDASVLPILQRWATSTWGMRVLMSKLEKARMLATSRRSAEITRAHLEQVDLEPVNVRKEEDES